MGEVVTLMRDSIRIQPQGDAIRVAFMYHEPQLAMRVAGRLSSLIIDAARVPERPVVQDRARTTSIGAAIGLLAGLGIAFRRPRPRG
jgi:hypothetical protein